MTKQFWILMGAGLAVVALGLSVLLLSTKSAHLELDGSILKVRVLEMNPNASLVIVDFRVKNPSDVPFVVKNVTTKFVPVSGDPTDGTPISKPDVENVFKYEKLLGPKFNDVLSIRDRIAPHETVDRMVGARFEMGESALDLRKAIHLTIEDLDGTIADITEKK
ncbi:MAG TPA: hypothetical protein VK419_08730 [Bryobacteraceae bacterium]|nr:hypothetical protein [Bryobacteraceae bacterium]